MEEKGRKTFGEVIKRSILFGKMMRMTMKIIIKSSYCQREASDSN